MSLEKIAQTIIEGNAEDAKTVTEELLKEGILPSDIITKGLANGIREIGDMWNKGEVFLPEVLCSADAFNTAVEVLKPHMQAKRLKKLGTAVIGTVEGDIHYIGKNLVAVMLEAASLDVIDLGEDISPQKFCNAVVACKPDIVALSCLISTSLIAMEETIRQLDKQGLHKGVKVMVGGPPISTEYAKKIGADLYAEDAFKAAEVAASAIGGDAS